MYIYVPQTLFVVVYNIENYTHTQAQTNTRFFCAFFMFSLVFGVIVLVPRLANTHARVLQHVCLIYTHNKTGQPAAFAIRSLINVVVCACSFLGILCVAQSRRDRNVYGLLLLGLLHV